jgi:hypothetical protein
LARSADLHSLQRSAGNRAVADLLTAQRLIIRPREEPETESLDQMKNDLEVQETVDKLVKDTGQKVDEIGGSKSVERPPAENYIIGHGNYLHQAVDWEPAGHGKGIDLSGHSAG